VEFAVPAHKHRLTGFAEGSSPKDANRFDAWICSDCFQSFVLFVSSLLAFTATASWATAPSAASAASARATAVLHSKVAA
jgi:hypothetical protein